MRANWAVTHRLDRPMEVVDEVEAYPDLGVRCVYDEGKLAAVHHEFETEEELSRAEAIHMSDRLLSCLWEILRYWWGTAPRFAERRAEPRSEAAEAAGPRRGHQAVAAAIAIAHRIRMPNEALLVNEPDRLRVHLWLANDARETTSDSDAIRNYYIILEDWENAEERYAGAIDPRLIGELRATRHFVSHARIDDDSVLEVLRENLGPGADRYDPGDDSHRGFVRMQRDQARPWIERELSARLEAGV